MLKSLVKGSLNIFKFLLEHVKGNNSFSEISSLSCVICEMFVMDINVNRTSQAYRSNQKL